MNAQGIHAWPTLEMYDMPHAKTSIQLIAIQNVGMYLSIYMFICSVHTYMYRYAHTYIHVPQILLQSNGHSVGAIKDPTCTTSSTPPPPHPAQLPPNPHGSIIKLRFRHTQSLHARLAYPPSRPCPRRDQGYVYQTEDALQQTHAPKTRSRHTHLLLQNHHHVEIKGTRSGVSLLPRSLHVIRTM